MYLRLLNKTLNLDSLIDLQSKQRAYWCTILIAVAILAVGGQWQLFTNAIFAPHDAIYPISNAIFNGRFGLFNAGENLSKNFAGFYLHAPDRVFVSILLNIGFRAQIVQLAHIVLCYWILVSLSFYFFTRVFSSSTYWILATISYCFSPFMAIFYSSGIFYVFSTVIALSLIPIFIHSLLHIDKQDRLIVILGCMFIFAFNLMFLVPACFMLAGALSFQFRRLGYECLRNIPLPIFIIAVFSVATVLLFKNLNDSILDLQNYLTNSAFSNIKGSIFYPLMQISSWAIYNGWQPRTILNFSDFYFSPPYKFLSITLILFVVSYLIEARKFLALVLLILGAFFAKGANFPLGEIYNWVVLKMPLGFMIRTPDTKFAPFILAIILVSMSLLSASRIKIVGFILCSFLICNLYGIYFHGALSAQVSGMKSTSYIPSGDHDKAAISISQYSDAVVISASDRCATANYEGYFHTCADPALVQIKNQVISKDGADLLSLIDRYNSFDSIVFFNLRKVDSTDNLQYFLRSSKYIGYSKIYESSNYLIFFKKSPLQKCNNHTESPCVIIDNSYLYSVPESFYRYYAQSPQYHVQNGLIFSAEKLEARNHAITYLQWLYCIAFLLNLGLVISYARDKN